MLNTYLLGLLKTLSPEEWRELDLCVRSPYFNRSHQAEEVRALFQAVWDTAPEFRPERLSRETVFTHLFPNQSFAEEKWEKLVAELNKLVRTFLLSRQYFAKSNEFERSLDLIRLLRMREQEARYQQEVARAAKLLDNEYRESAEGFYRRFQLEEEIHLRLAQSNHAKGDLNIPELVQAFDLYYLTYRLDLQNRFLSQQSLTYLPSTEELSFRWMEGVLPIYRVRSALLLLTEKTCRLLSDAQPSVEAFQELMNLLLVHEQAISPEVTKRLFTCLRNYCTILINEGNAELVNTLHLIYRDNLDRGYLYYEGKIHHSAYLNVARMALRAGELEWAKSFIEIHRHKIWSENETEDFYHLNLATYLFADRQFQEALDILPLTPAYSDAHLLARRLELKAYHELDSELLPYRIDAFKMFLSRASRKSLPAMKHQYQTNFVNLLHQLTQSIPGDKARSAQLLKRIESKKLVAERDWLLEKAREIGAPGR